MDPERAYQMWPDIGEYVDRALAYSHDDTTQFNIMAGILNERMICAVITIDHEIQGVGILEVAQLRNHRVLHCPIFSGDDLESWVEEWMDVWVAIARELKCDRVTIKGRQGWARYAKRFGFEHQYTMMSLDIEG